MNLKRKAFIASLILYAVSITFAGIAAVNFFRGVSQRDGTLEAGRAQIALVSATIGIAFGVLAGVIPVAFRDW